MEARRRCRLFHSWDVVPSDHWFTQAKSVGGIPLTLRCENCGAERRDTRGTNTRELVTRKYVYADGYLLAKGEERPEKADLWLALATEMLDQVRRKRRS